MQVKNIKIGDIVYLKRYISLKEVPLKVLGFSKSRSNKTTYVHLSDGTFRNNSELVSEPCGNKICSECKRK